MGKVKMVEGYVYLENDSKIPLTEAYLDFFERLFPDSGAPVNTVVIIAPEYGTDSRLRLTFTKSGISAEKL